MRGQPAGLFTSSIWLAPHNNHPTQQEWGMTRHRDLAVLAVFFGVALAAAGITLSLAAGDPFVGTFAMNGAKSTADPGPLPKSYTLKTEDAGGGKVTTTGDTVFQDDSVVHWQVTYLRDGTPAAMSGNPNVDTVSAKQINPNTLEISETKGGNVVNSLTVQVSADGTTMTSTITGKAPDGKPFKNVIVSEKQ
jgi:hypothetical protein